MPLAPRREMLGSRTSKWDAGLQPYARDPQQETCPHFGANRGTRAVTCIEPVPITPFRTYLIYASQYRRVNRIRPSRFGSRN